MCENPRDLVSSVIPRFFVFFSIPPNLNDSPHPRKVPSAIRILLARPLIDHEQGTRLGQQDDPHCASTLSGTTAPARSEKPVMYSREPGSYPRGNTPPVRTQRSHRKSKQNTFAGGSNAVAKFSVVLRRFFPRIHSFSQTEKEYPRPFRNRSPNAGIWAPTRKVRQFHNRTLFGGRFRNGA